jgi:uncharacterized repeat protein (TIGR01451 family)
VDVSISPSENSAENGKTVTFTVTIRNTGNVTEDYDLSNTDDAGWGAWLDENMLTIPAGENTTVTVSVTVPSDASEGDSTMITVTATSQENAQVENSATCTAQAISRIIRGVDVSISPSENSAENGKTVTFTVTIRNTGNVTENYNLSKTDDAGWTLTLQSSVTVPSGENRQVTLSVGIPATAANDTLDNITVTTISSENAVVSDSASCTAHCVVSITPPPPGTSPLIYVGVAAVIVVIIAAILILKLF